MLSSRPPLALHPARVGAQMCPRGMLHKAGKAWEGVTSHVLTMV